MNSPRIFEPLKFKKITFKNRIVRSSVSGRFDHYNGFGTQTRINWEEKFARGGVGAIISSFVPVSIPGRILPNFATIHADECIPFWKRLGETIHEYDCRYILQLSHCGRQRDIGGVENIGQQPISSTNQMESVHGLTCRAMSKEEIQGVIEQFAEGARRAQEAGLDGVELHGAHGYLITQFLSSAINDRTDEYGGNLENRARFLLEVIKAIRKKVGEEFHLQVKINGTDYDNAVNFWQKPGNTIDETVQICQWIESAGVDAIHVSTGSFFPHPFCPPGDFPLKELSRTYGAMISWGKLAFRNYILFRYSFLRPLFKLLWDRMRSDREIEGINEMDSKKIKEGVSIPVMCTGGFQTASKIEQGIEQGYFDAVAITRALIANNDLPKIFMAGKDQPDKPCTYCNKCLVNVLDSPMGCYDVSRYGGDQAKMIEEVMAVFHPSSFL